MRNAAKYVRVRGQLYRLVSGQEQSEYEKLKATLTDMSDANFDTLSSLVDIMSIFRQELSGDSPELAKILTKETAMSAYTLTKTLLTMTDLAAEAAKLLPKG